MPRKFLPRAGQNGKEESADESRRISYAAKVRRFLKITA